MNYQITFKDRTSIIVDNERGEQVKEIWMSGEKNIPLDIDGNGYLVGTISKIEQIPEPQTLVDSSHQLESKVCRGQYSIQNKINKIIKDEGEGWAKRIQSLKYRETIRKQLRGQAGVLWCDYKAKECVCD